MKPTSLPEGCDDHRTGDDGFLARFLEPESPLAVPAPA